MNEKEPINLKGRTDLADLNSLVFKAGRDGFAAGKVWLDGPQRHAMCLAMRVAHGFVEAYASPWSNAPLPDGSSATPEEVAARDLSSIFAESRYSSTLLCTVSPDGRVFDARYGDGLGRSVPSVSLAEYGLNLLAAELKACHADALYEAAMARPDAEKRLEECRLHCAGDREHIFRALVHEDALRSTSDLPIYADTLMTMSRYGDSCLGLGDRTLAMRTIESPTLAAEAAAADLPSRETFTRRLLDDISLSLGEQEALAQALDDPALVAEAERSREILSALGEFRGNPNVWLNVPTRGDALRVQMPVEDLRRCLHEGHLDSGRASTNKQCMALFAAVDAGGPVRVGEIASVTYGRKTYWEGEPLVQSDAEDKDREEPDPDRSEPTCPTPIVDIRDGHGKEER